MNIPILKTKIGTTITQKINPNTISPTMVGELFTDLAQEHVYRGVLQLPNTNALSSIDPTDTNLCLVASIGFFRFLNFGGAPNNTTTFATASVGLWVKVDLPADLTTGVFVEVTKSELDSLITNGDLFPGADYLIMDADVALYGGTPIVLKALSRKKIANSGLGYFANPIYNKGVAGFNVWSNISTLQTATLSNFSAGDTITLTDVPMSSGTVVAVLGTQIYFTANTESLWASGTAVSNGSISNTVTYRSIATYATNSLVIWGGKVWKNNTGLTGKSTDSFTLNSAWTLQQVTFDNSVIDFGVSAPYALAIDEIEYDYDADKIIFRKESEGSNEVRTSKGMYPQSVTNFGNPIKFFQWGNPISSTGTGAFTGIGGLSIINSLIENINFTGKFQKDISFSNFSFQMGVNFIGNSSQESISFNNSKQLNTIFLNSTQKKIVYQNFTIDRSGEAIVASAEANTFATETSIQYAFSCNFNGSAFYGAVGEVGISHFSILPGMFIESVFADCSTLTSGANSKLNLGFTDAPLAGINDATGKIADLSGQVSKVGNSSFVKSNGQYKKMILSVNTANVSSGNISFLVNLKRVKNY